MYNPNILEECKKKALFSCTHSIGGPFGAAVVKNGLIVEVQTNTVLSSKDPTSHAEINAIRSASIKLETYDLSGCELYTTGFPCPMCLGAIMWSNIKKVYVSGTLEDAATIGFKDNFIYETIDKLNKKCYNNNVLDIEFKDREQALELYKKYEENKGIIY